MPTTTSSAIARKALLAGGAAAMITMTMLACCGASAPRTSPAVGAATRPALSEANAGATITIEHVTYQKPYPNTLYKMTDSSTGIVCYYTLIGIPACIQVLPRSELLAARLKVEARK
jgi:hypothetical protein